MPNAKNSSGKNSTSNKSSDQASNQNAKNVGMKPSRKIPSFTSGTPDDTERRDGPGGN